MEVHTGASSTIISRETFHKLWPTELALLLVPLTTKLGMHVYHEVAEDAEITFSNGCNRCAHDVSKCMSYAHL